METIGATILKQLQALASRANTLLQRMIHDALPTARALQRDVRDAEHDLTAITQTFNREEEGWMKRANQALEELVGSR